MTTLSKRPTQFEPVCYLDGGHMLLIDGKHKYWYSGIKGRKGLSLIRAMCKRGHKGRVYQYLKKHCTYEGKEDEQGKVSK